MELLPWINPKFLSRRHLNCNPNAIDYLLTNKITLDYYMLASNPSAYTLLNKCTYASIDYNNLITNTHPSVYRIINEIHSYAYNEWLYRYNQYCEILSQRYDVLKILSKYELNLYGICRNRNPIVLNYILEHIDTLDLRHWTILSSNPTAIDILLDNIDKIDWYILSINPCEKAIQLLTTYNHKINWSNLSSNYYAIDLLLENPHRIDWEEFSCNTHPKAIEYMKLHLKKLNWYYISRNPSAIELLEQNRHKICWTQLSMNPSIFQYNYQPMAMERTNQIREELLQVTLHPSRISYWLSNGMSIEDL
jgi:hypothetical protein